MRKDGAVDDPPLEIPKLSQEDSQGDSALNGDSSWSTPRGLSQKSSVTGVEQNGERSEVSGVPRPALAESCTGSRRNTGGAHL